MTTGFETIIYEKDGPVAHVVLNRPEVVNAYNTRMRDDLYQALQAVRDDSEVRAVIVRGEGEKGFCAGADLTEFGTAPSQAIARQVRWQRDVWGLFLDVPKPFICAMHGYVMGSGVEIAALCDLRVVTEDVVFAMPEAALGMIPAAGGSQTVPRAIGSAAALEVLLTNRRMGAHEALRLGLAHRLVQRNALVNEATWLAQTLVERPPTFLRAVRESVRRGNNLPLAQGLALEERLALQAWRERQALLPQP